MKLLIAGDIHGSAQYALALRELFLTQWPDRLVLTGDLLHKGPHSEPPGYVPAEVTAILNSMKDRVVAVQGNCDTEEDQLALAFPILSVLSMLFVDGHAICLTHGHIYGPSNPPPLSPGDILLCGHTHAGVERPMGEGVYLNPGSIALPKDGQYSFMIYEKGIFTRLNLAEEILGSWTV